MSHRQYDKYYEEKSFRSHFREVPEDMSKADKHKESVDKVKEYNKKKNNFWHRLNSSEEFAAKVKSLKNIVTNRYFQAASLGLLGVVYYWSTKSGQWELETAHMKNGYPMMAIEKISEDERLKLAFGGKLSFEKFMHEGDDNVWNDAEGDGHAQCVFKVNGENEAFGYVLLEAQQPCTTFQWELSRVYLHFFKDERSKPLHIQVMNVLSKADEDNISENKPE